MTHRVGAWWSVVRMIDPASLETRTAPRKRGAAFEPDFPDGSTASRQCSFRWEAESAPSTSFLYEAVTSVGARNVLLWIKRAVTNEPTARAVTNYAIGQA